jgi:Ca2+/Na+ antiporter
MNFLNAITSAYFKTAQDGSTVFYPWSIWVRGYTLPSAQDQQRLQQQLKVYLAVTFVLILIIVNIVSTPVYFAIGGTLTVFYVLWMLYAVRRLPRAGERLSLDESLTIQARTHHIVVLWLFAALSLFAVVCSIVMLAVAPGNWLIAILGTALFGLALAKAIRMLVLRYRVVARP